MKNKLKMAASTGRTFLQVSKQCRIFHRNFSTSLRVSLGRHATQTEEETHVYKNSMNNRDVIDYLIKNVAFENEDWIVTNKPYGVGMRRPSNIVSGYNPRTFSDVYLEELLPLLAQELNLNSIDLLFQPERFTSGVTILGKRTEGVEKYKENHLMNIKRGILQYGFIAVTLFEPVPKSGKDTFKLKLNKENKSVEINKRRKSSTGAIIKCSHELIDSSRFCSLVKVESNKVIHNCISEYLQKTCLSPILGELSFHLSVSKIGNISFPVVGDAPVRDSKNLDPELLMQLKLDENEVSLIPKHLHLKSVMFKMEKNEEFFVSVPPPDSFLWTCKQLNLSENRNYD